MHVFLLLISTSLLMTPSLATTPAPSAQGIVRSVSTTLELERALANARAGDVIQLADGVYQGNFVAGANGTSRSPITLAGSRRAVIDGGRVKKGYGLHLRGDYWVLRGFTVTNAQKGIMADGASHSLLEGLHVTHTGDEAIHFRGFSSHNTVRACEISDTGLRKPGYGEGVYLGSAKSNWQKYSEGRPDRSDHNRVLDNRFGPDVRAEAIDIKEGTTGGEIRGNVFDGRGMRGKNYADSWVDVKGNGYLIADNQGTSTLKDGFQTHTVLDGWGRDNVFRGNIADVGGDGYAIRIQLDGDDPVGNIVYRDNRALNAAGVTNVPLTPMPSGSALEQ